MAIHHAHPGEPIDVQPLGARLPEAKTSALFKSADLEVTRLVLLAGKSLPPHKVPGEITIQCIGHYRSHRHRTPRDCQDVTAH